MNEVSPELDQAIQKELSEEEKLKLQIMKEENGQSVNPQG